MASAVHFSSEHPEDIGLLPTIMTTIMCEDFPRQYDDTPIRCLLDSWAQNSFVTSAAVSKYHLHTTSGTRKFTVAGGETIPSKGVTKFYLKTRSPSTRVIPVFAHILPNITGDLPTVSFGIGPFTHLKGIPLADLTFNTSGPVDALLGATVFDLVMKADKIPGPPGLPSAYLTNFGYIIMGGISPSLTVNALTEPAVPPSQPTIGTKAESANNESSLQPEFNMEKFWQIEELPTKHPLTDMERMCEQHYINNTTRLSDGRYQVRWPFLEDPATLGSSFNCAKYRWEAVERRLVTTPELHATYNAQLQEYLDLGFMESVSSNEVFHHAYYIPHHAVFKPSSTSTKVRIVFDASVKTSAGNSLNSIMATGPTIQPDLFDQLLQFRLYPVAIAADVKKMYLQIRTHLEEWDLARILWRSDPKKPLQHYRLRIVAFGVTASPYLACRTLFQAATDEGATADKTRFYVDDFMSSYPNAQHTIRVKDELVALLSTAHFNLSKWSSKSPQVLETIPEPERATQLPLSMDPSATVQTLGLR